MLMVEALRAAGRHDRASCHQTRWLIRNGIIERRLQPIAAPASATAQSLLSGAK